MANLGKGTPGEFLKFDDDGYPISAPASGGGGGLASLLNTPEWRDDFLFGGTDTGNVGELGWLLTSSGTSAGVGYESGLVGYGTIDITTGTTTTGRTSISCNQMNAVNPAQGEITYKCRLTNSALSDASNSYTIYAGIYDNTSMSNSGEGVYFTYNHAINSGNWTLNTSDDPGSNTTADSGVAVTTGFDTWQTLTIVLNADSTSCEFFIDGVSVGTITTTLPQSGDYASPFFGIIKDAGTSARSLWVDVFYMKYALTTPRFL